MKHSVAVAIIITQMPTEETTETIAVGEEVGLVLLLETQTLKIIQLFATNASSQDTLPILVQMRNLIVHSIFFRIDRLRASRKQENFLRNIENRSRYNSFVCYIFDMNFCVEGRYHISED